MQLTLVHFLAAATVFAAPSAPAQDRPAVSPPAAMRTAHGVTVEDDAIFAGGHAYKARFARGDAGDAPARSSVEFTPAFGDAVAHNLPLSLHAIAFGRAGSMQAAVATEPRVDGDRVRYERGAGASERFDALAAGIEWSWSFATPVPGDGDLVVRTTVSTELKPVSRADGSLAFVVPGIGGVTIGTVTGIDATGRTTPGTLRLDGDVLELTLPATFVDGATFPLLLDPLIGTEFQVGTSDDVACDIAWERSGGSWLLAWERRLSASDRDILAQRLDVTGALYGPLLFLDATARVTTRPRIGSVAGSQRFLVVWEDAATLGGPRDVRGRPVHSSSLLFSTAIATIAGGAGDEFAPCVSSETTGIDDEALVVWETSSGIDAMQVTIDTTTSAPILNAIVPLTTSAFAHTPAISKTGAGLGRHMVVWSETRLLGDRELVGMVVDRDLNVLAPPTTLTANALDDTRPAVDGDGSTFVVAYEQAEAANPGLHDVRALRANYAAGALTVGVADVPIAAVVGHDEATPDTAWLGQKHCIVFADRRSGLPADIGVVMVADTCATCGTRVTLSGIDPLRDEENAPRVHGRWAYDLTSDDGIVAFVEAQQVLPFASSVICQRIEALGPGAPPVVVSPGCGNGGTAGSFGGPFVLGNGAFRFRVTGLDPAAVAFLALGFQDPGLPVCPACTVLNPVSLSFQLNANGVAASLFALPCSTQFLGAALDCQWLAFNSGANPCAAFAGVSASERLRFTVFE